MQQFGKIMKFELKNYFTNKIFVGITVFLVIAITVVMFIPRLLVQFDSEEAEAVPSGEKAIMLIRADTEEQEALVRESFSYAFTDYDIQTTQDDIDAIREQIMNGSAACAFVMTSPTTYTYYVDNLTMYDNNPSIAYDVLQNVYRMNAMIDHGMTPEEAGEVMNIQISGEVESLGKDQIENFFYTYIMIFALYIVILLYGQMVTTSVATEKSSRAMELLITSARPVALMFGKVLSACLAGFLQLAVVFGSAMLFFNLNREYWNDTAPILRSFFDIPGELLIFMLVFFVLGFLLYAFLFGAVGSTTSKLEDINTSTMPLMFTFIIAFMVVMFSMTSGNVDNTAMIVCSYIPFTSPMAMFTRIAMSTVPWYEIALSIAILIGSTIGIGVLSAKIYRVGVLMYGNPPKLPAIIKAALKA